MINRSYKPNIFVEIIGFIIFILGVCTGNLLFFGILLIIAITSQFL